MLLDSFQNKASKYQLAFTSLIALFASCLALAAPYALVKAVDDGISKNSMPQLLIWLSVCVGTQILAAYLSFAAQKQTKTYGLAAEHARASALFAAALNAELVQMRQTSQGEMMGRCLLAAESEGTWLSARLSQGVQLAVTLVGVCGILFYFSWQLAVFALVPFILVGIFYAFLRKHWQIRSKQALHAQEAVFGLLHESFRLLDTIQALNLAPAYQTAFDTKNTDYCQHMYRYQKTMLLQGSMLDVLQALLILAVFGYGGYLILHEQTLSIGILLGFQIYLAKIFASLRTAGQLLSAHQHYMEAQKRGNEIQNMERTTHFKPAPSQNALVLQNASFAYGTRTIFSKLSLTLPLGQNLAVLGPSGLGKTSLAYCILGLYPLQSGQVLWPEGHKNLFGFVPQEALLFSQSLRDNIVVDKCTPPSPEQLDQILYCCALQEIAQSHGLDSFVGDGGQTLSGGERKRVLLARALALNPQIILIDQMSSELEPECCQRIFERIQQHYPHISIIYFGHRVPEGLIIHQHLDPKAFTQI